MPELDDLLNTLREDSAGGPVPDAALVRRRGDVLRRRRRAAAGAGVAAAVLAIGAVAVPALSGRDADRAPVATQPAPQPVSPTVTTIPDDLPLTAGMPDGTRSVAGRDWVPSATGPCGARAYTPAEDDRVATYRAAVYTDPSEGGLDRALVVYRQPSAADAAVADLLSDVTACTPDQARSQGWDAVRLGPAAGVAAWAVRHLDERGQLDGSGFVTVVEQSANALLISSTYLGSVGDRQVLDQTVAMLEQRDAPVLEAMRSTYGD